MNYYSVVQPEIASITVEGAQMNEKFDPDVHAYMGSVPNGTTSVNITAECTEGLVLSIGNTTATSGQPVNVALGCLLYTSGREREVEDILIGITEKQVGGEDYDLLLGRDTVFH